jgi:hypothetical protein
MIDHMPCWTVRVLAVTFILIAAACFVLATWRYTHQDLMLARADLRTVPVPGDAVDGHRAACGLRARARRPDPV